MEERTEWTQRLFDSGPQQVKNRHTAGSYCQLYLYVCVCIYINIDIDIDMRVCVFMLLDMFMDCFALLPLFRGCL